MSDFSLQRPAATGRRRPRLRSAWRRKFRIPYRSGFLSVFFTLVGTYGTHVVVGLTWMAVMVSIDFTAASGAERLLSYLP